MAYDKAEVGHRLRVIRTDRKLTRGELASKCGVDESTISKIELGINGASLDTAVSIALALDCSVDELAGLKPPNVCVTS